MRARFPNSPWRGDYFWNPSGTDDRILFNIGKCFIGVGASVAYLLILYYGDPWSPFRLAQPAVLLNGFVGFLCLAIGGALLHTYLRRGEMFLRFESFPYRLGEKLSATLVYPKLFQDFDEIEILLRCVEEKQGSSRRFGKHKKTVECDQLFEAKLRFEKGKDYRENSASVPITFELPKNGKPTSLMKKPIVCWEIEIRYDEDEDDEKASRGMLVPVY